MKVRALVVFSTFIIFSCTPEPSNSSKSLVLNPELEAVKQFQEEQQAQLEAKLLNASDLSNIALADELSEKAIAERSEIEESLLIQAKLSAEEDAKLLVEAARLEQDKLPPRRF